MQYKILLIKNRYTKKVDLKEGLEWFKKNTPLDVVIADTIETDFDVVAEQNGNGGAKGYTIDEDILIPQLRTLVPEGKYHCVVFLYGNKMPGVRVSEAPRLPIYPGTDLIETFKGDDSGKTLNHEIFHTFFHRLLRQQIVLEDPMDSVIINGNRVWYYNNSNLNAKPSNRSISLERLAPHWNKVAHILILNQPVPPPKPASSRWKYFKPDEKTGSTGTIGDLSFDLVDKLDVARGYSGIAYVITSGFRTAEHNEEVNGVDGSAHTKGLAVDIRARNSNEHYLITYGLMMAGITRISKKYAAHVHADIDPTKPQRVLF